MSNAHSAAQLGTSEPTGGRRSLVQAGLRAFGILDILRASPSPMTVQEIATQADLDRTVTHRLVKSLLMQAVVVEDRGAFRVGPATVLLANRYIDDLLVRRLALPYMIEIS